MQPTFNGISSNRFAPYGRCSIGEYREIEKERIAELLGEERIFRFSYVPFVICELAWDYADSIIDLAILYKNKDTRKLSRRIRELRKEYEAIHVKFIDEAHRKSEINNMYIYEKIVKDIFKTYIINLRCDLKSEYPDISEDDITYLVAVYQCHVVLQSLFLYVKRLTKEIEGILNRRIGSIIADPVKELAKLVPQYLRGRPASEKFDKLQETYILTFATQMALIEFTKSE